MKVKELKELLNDFDNDLKVAIGDYSKIADEDERVFHDVEGVEQLTADSKEIFVSIFMECKY